MPDQFDYPCPAHDPAYCRCDEDRDRAAGLHRASATGSVGGYECVCGAPIPCRSDRPLPPEQAGS